MYKILSKLGLSREVIVLICSMLPVIELRGSIPLGISIGLTVIRASIISIVGNIILMFFLVPMFEPITNFLEKTSLFENTLGWVKKRSMKKADLIKEYSLIGLYFFIAIPIPTTGVWTGSILVNLLNLNRKKSYISMLMGILTSAIIINLLYYGLFS